MQEQVFAINGLIEVEAGVASFSNDSFSGAILFYQLLDLVHLFRVDKCVMIAL